MFGQGTAAGRVLLPMEQEASVRLDEGCKA